MQTVRSCSQGISGLHHMPVDSASGRRAGLSIPCRVSDTRSKPALEHTLLLLFQLKSGALLWHFLALAHSPSASCSQDPP